MDVPKDMREQREWMLNVLIKDYGIPGHVISAHSQPNLVDLPRPPEEQQKAGKPDAQELKTNYRLYDVLAHFQQQHGLFTEGGLTTDCPIHPWFAGEPAQDKTVYQRAFRIVPRDHGYLAFTCDSTRCERFMCPIHRSTRFLNQKFDPFDLLQVLDSIRRGYHFDARHGNIADYARELGSALGVETTLLRAKKGESHQGLGRYRGMRYPANKNQLLIELTASVPQSGSELAAFIDRVWRLVWVDNQPEPYYDQTRSDTLVWFPASSSTAFRESGAASRLWLYLWILQQQQRGKVVADTKAFAEVLGVDSRSIHRYAKQLEQAGKLVRSENPKAKRPIPLWTVKA